MDDVLYGQEGDEILHTDEQSAVEEAVERAIWRGPNPATWAKGHTFTVEVTEFSTLRKGDSGATVIPDGSWLAERVADDFCEEAGFEELGDQYLRAAKDPDVIASFQSALDHMKAKQTFLVADKAVKVWCEIITVENDDGDWEWTDRYPKVSDTEATP
jgi:hypothetical protein